VHFIVCIKQVPDTNEVRMDPVTNTLVRAGVDSIVNPFDLFAVEEALRWKERLGGSVTALTMGPPQAEAALREIIALGVDRAVLLTDAAFAGSDTWATSYTLALAVRRLGRFDLIVCGKQAADGDTAQVGPGLAAHLDLPQITYVRRVESLSGGRIVAQRLLETGTETIEAPLPCVVTVVKEINEPRLPTLRGRIAARRAAVERWGPADLGADPAKLGLNGSPTRVVRITAPPPRSGGERLAGDPETVARTLASRLSGVVPGKVPSPL
jgi:electron transfer flavoprotein beta subunit